MTWFERYQIFQTYWDNEISKIIVKDQLNLLVYNQENKENKFHNSVFYFRAALLFDFLSVAIISYSTSVTQLHRLWWGSVRLFHIFIFVAFSCLVENFTKWLFLGKHDSCLKGFLEIPKTLKHQQNIMVLCVGDNSDAIQGI